jgi:hypothetical protein
VKAPGELRAGIRALAVLQGLPLEFAKTGLVNTFSGALSSPAIFSLKHIAPQILQKLTK